MKIKANKKVIAMCLCVPLVTSNLTYVSASEVAKESVTLTQVVNSSAFQYENIGKNGNSGWSVENIDGGVKLTAGNGKLSSTDDSHVYYYLDVDNSESFSFTANMKVTGLNDTGSTSNQSYAGIMLKDKLPADLNEQHAYNMAGTGIRVSSGTVFNTSNFTRAEEDTSPTVVGDASGSVGNEAVYQLTVDKFGDTVRMSVNGFDTVDETIISKFTTENSKIGVFVTRNLVAEFTDIQYTKYNKGELIVELPTKTKYIAGFETEVDTTGMVVSYNGEVLEAGQYLVSDFKDSKSGDESKKDITISYGLEEFTFEVNIIKPTLTQLSLVYKPIKDVYYKNQQIDLSGLLLSRVYNDSDEFVAESIYGDSKFNDLFTVSKLNTTTNSATQTVVVTSKENSDISVSFPVDVKLLNLSSISVQEPVKTVYYVGDGKEDVIDLDTKGMTVKAIYEADGVSESEIVEFNDSNLNISKVNTKEAGEQNILVSYTVGEETVNHNLLVNVLAVKEDNIEIVELPKTTYTVGEEFSLEGLKVIANNNNGTSYELTLDENYTVDYSSIDNSQVGSYTVNITTNSLDIANKNISFTVTYREAFVPKFESIIFGQSTSTSKTYVNADGVEENANQVVVNEDGSVRVVSVSGAGKVTGSHDGIAYYYFELDPSKDNFSVSADVYVTSYSKDVSGSTMKHDGQESFGIMARDAIGENGNSTVFASNIALVGGFAGSTRVDNGIQGVLRSGVNPNDSNSVIVTDVQRLTTERGYKMVGETYALTLEKDNSGFLMSVNGSKPVRLFADSDELALTDSDKMYVGFYAGREADITVSNIDVKVTDKFADKVQEFAPEIPTTPEVTFTSLDKFGGDKYDVTFTQNVDGIVKVKNGSKVLVDGLEVKADKEVSLNTNLALGDNTFTIEFWPDSTQNIDSSSKVVEVYNVNRRVLGTEGVVYASNTGVSTNAGTSSSNVDVQTAFDYAVAGQTILLADGVYTLESTLSAPKGVNGTKDNKITVKPLSDSNSNVVFDFNKVGGGLRISGDFWHFFKVNVTGSADNSNAIVLSGNDNILESSNAYKNGNTGIQISALSGSATRDIWPNNNIVINCSSFENIDPSNNNADGFAAKITVGEGNKFIGCIAYSNADDGWDLYAKTESGPIGAVALIDCIAYGNGYIDGVATGGDMNGFKLGGEGIAVNHTITRSVAFNNGANGFDSNSNPNVIANKNISFNNVGANANFTTYTNVTPAFKISNFVSFYTADYRHKSKDNYEIGQVPLSDTFSETTYFFNGIITENSEKKIMVLADTYNIEADSITRGEEVIGATESNINFGDFSVNFSK